MNDKNLVSLKSRSKEERQAIARKGAKASTQAKKEKKIIKEEIIKHLGDKDLETIVKNLIERAKTEDKAFEILRDTLGQKPKQDVGLLNQEDENVTIHIGFTDENGNRINKVTRN